MSDRSGDETDRDDTHTVTTQYDDVTRREATTPIDDRIRRTTARAAALDPATARVVGARVEAGELVVELVGEPV